MKKREIQEINASSMADISFLLLIFFLVTTSMATDKGLSRTLPPPSTNEEKTEDIEVNKRNILMILVNSSDKLMVNGELMDVSKLKDRAKEFIDNPGNKEDLPEKELVNVPYIGSKMVTTKHVISLQNDRGTSYQAYIAVQNELVAAYNELRNELSTSKFMGRTYDQLTEDEQDAVKQVYPQKISEAEPKNYGQVSGGAQ